MEYKTLCEKHGIRICMNMSEEFSVIELEKGNDLYWFAEHLNEILSGTESIKRYVVKDLKKTKHGNTGQ